MPPSILCIFCSSKIDMIVVINDKIAKTKAAVDLLGFLAALIPKMPAIVLNMPLIINTNTVIPIKILATMELSNIVNAAIFVPPTINEIIPSISIKIETNTNNFFMIIPPHKNAYNIPLL